MINHVRSLLMNVSSSSRADLPGEEYVPADFRPRLLSTATAAARRILFGSSPDRLYLNYRLREYMTLLHTTELAEFVTDLDPRVTYWPLRDTDIFADTFRNQVSLVTGSTAATLVVLGDETPNHVLGQLRHEFRITVSAPETVQIERLTLPTATESVGVPTTNGLTTAIALPGSSVSFRIQTGDSDNDLTDLVGTTWLLETRARPSQGLDTVLSRLQTGLGPVSLLELFGLGQTEPQKTWLNLWQTSPYLPYKLGALLLGVAYRMNALPSEPFPPVITPPAEIPSSSSEAPAAVEHTQSWDTGNIVDNIWSWTVPADAIDTVTFEGWGGGAIGGTNPGILGARGGGGGAYARVTIAAQPGRPYTGFVGRSTSDGLDFENVTSIQPGAPAEPVIMRASGGIQANGGEAASCTGDVVFSGGGGAADGEFNFSPPGRGGGGGSSAGPASDGNSVSSGVVIGATAVTGGGKGGDGGVSPAVGEAGQTPGGGGGGGHGQGGVGGNAGAGRIKVTWYTAA